MYLIARSPHHCIQYLIHLVGAVFLITYSILIAGCASAPMIEGSLVQEASKGNVAAQYDIGMKYFDAWNSSFGDKALLDEAARWFEMAARQGDARAHYRMAKLTADHRQSFEWLQLPAQQGIAQAQHELGVHYAQAWGTPQDLVLAYKWIALAFEGGVPDPVGKLANLDWLVLNGKMRPDQIAEGQRLTREHSALHGISRPIGLFK